MEFQDYIKTLNIVSIPVLIRANSDITIEQAFDVCVERVERVSAQYPKTNVWLSLTDLRDNNKYTVFSAAMMRKYGINDQVNLDLDMVAVKTAIDQSRPDSIRAIVRDELAGLSLDQSVVLHELKQDPQFLKSVQQINRHVVVEVGVVHRSARLSVQRRSLPLSIHQRSVNIEVVRDANQ